MAKVHKYITTMATMVMPVFIGQSIIKSLESYKQTIFDQYFMELVVFITPK